MLTALLLLSPVILIALLAKFLEDGHSPIYVSKRIGKNGKPFRFYKIRTMVPNADEMKQQLIDAGIFAYSTETRERIWEEDGWGADELVIGHVGRFNEQKNHLYLIDIFEQVVRRNPRCRLCLCGGGEFRERNREEVARRGLSDKVVFKGNIPNANEYYQALDVFVLPSLCMRGAGLRDRGPGKLAVLLFCGYDHKRNRGRGKKCALLYPSRGIRNYGQSIFCRSPKEKDKPKNQI